MSSHNFDFIEKLFSYWSNEITWFWLRTRTQQKARFSLGFNGSEYESTLQSFTEFLFGRWRNPTEPSSQEVRTIVARRILERR